MTGPEYGSQKFMTLEAVERSSRLLRLSHGSVVCSLVFQTLYSQENNLKKCTTLSTQIPVASAHFIMNLLGRGNYYLLQSWLHVSLSARF